jgi:hypothetical protein
LKTVISDSTEQEVKAFGALMHEVLSHLSKWYTFGLVYDHEACSRKAVDLPSYARRGANAGANEDQLSHMLFRDVIHQWQVNLHEVCTKMAAHSFCTSQISAAEINTSYPFLYMYLVTRRSVQL